MYAGHLLVVIHSKSNQNHSSVDIQTNSMNMRDIAFIQQFNEQNVNIKKRLRLRMQPWLPEKGNEMLRPIEGSMEKSSGMTSC